MADGARVLAAEKIEFPDTFQINLMGESFKNHQVNMGHLAFDLAMLRSSSMFNMKSAELWHLHNAAVLDGVVANELLVSNDPMQAGLMNLFARTPTTLEHPAFSPSQNQPPPRPV